MSQIMVVRCGNLVGADAGRPVGGHISVAHANLCVARASYLFPAHITVATSIRLIVNRSRRCQLVLCLVSSPGLFPF